MRDITRRYGVDVHLTIDGDVDTLPDRFQTCVYRAIQEALTNCVRHAKARTIAVTVTATAKALTIAVTDDGVGFDQNAAHHGLGLRGIGERVKEIGGTLTITSRPGQGTALVIQLPQAQTTTEVRLARVAG